MDSISEVPRSVNSEKSKCNTCALNRGTAELPLCAGGYRLDRRGWCGGWRAIPEPVNPEVRRLRIAKALESWALYCERPRFLGGYRSRARRARAQGGTNE